MRLVGGERAVLAVAPAGPGQRERQIAREGDSAAHERSLGARGLGTGACTLSRLHPFSAPSRKVHRMSAGDAPSREGTRFMGVYLARHGQTEYNLLGRFQGHLPVPLDVTGLAQAADLAERARRHSFSALWCSPLLQGPADRGHRRPRDRARAARGRAPGRDRRRRLDRPHLRAGPLRDAGAVRRVRVRGPGLRVPGRRVLRAAGAARQRRPARRRSRRAAGARRLPRDGDPGRPARPRRRALRAGRKRGAGAARPARGRARRPRRRSRHDADLSGGAGGLRPASPSRSATTTPASRRASCVRWAAAGSSVRVVEVRGARADIGGPA